MTIWSRPFVEIDIDFTGKNTTELRQQYLEDIAAILEKEYQQEIESAGNVEFFCSAGSRMQFIEVSELDLLQLDIKVKAARFIKQNETAL